MVGQCTDDIFFAQDISNGEDAAIEEGNGNLEEGNTQPSLVKGDKGMEM